MILTMFIVLCSLALVLVILGYLRPEHTELAVIGFLFILLLSFQISNGTLTYPSGVTKTTTNTFIAGLLTSAVEVDVNNYSAFSDSNQHYYGYALALLCGISIAILLWNTKNGTKKQEDKDEQD